MPTIASTDLGFIIIIPAHGEYSLTCQVFLELDLYNYISLFE